MNELLLTLGGLIASLGNVKSVAVVKEHVALLSAKLQLLKDDIEKLEKENSDLVRRNADLEEQALRQKESEQFVESRGALFKRTADGYSVTPYCPSCRRSMFCLRHMFPYACTNKVCGHVADFKGNQLQDVMARLPPK